MKNSTVRWMISTLGAMSMCVWLQGCASQNGGDQPGDQVDGSNDKDAAAAQGDDAAQNDKGDQKGTDAAAQGQATDGNSQDFSEKDTTNMQGGQASADAAGGDGAALNNAPDESFATSQSQQADATAEKTGNAQTQTASATPAQADNAVATPAANVPQTKDHSAVASAAPVAAAPSQAAGAPAVSAPQPGGVVRYVPTSGTSTYASPTDKSVVSSLERGDHPLVWTEGEWARTADGKYVPASALVTQPVGRTKAPNPWK